MVKPLRVAYVLTCAEENLYVRGTLLSIQLLRAVEPRAEVVLLTDTSSRQVLESTPLLKWVDHCRAEPLEQDSAVLRSRELKVRMRSLVEGDFAFLDSDVLPIRPFLDVFEREFDVAAVLDRNHINPFPHFPHWFAEDFQQLGWPHPLSTYYNSGVLFFRDSPAVRQFGDDWERAWRTQLRVRGLHFDQPSFNHSLHQSKLRIATLDSPYNALVRASPWLGKEARLLHFHAHQHSDKLGSGDLLGRLLEVWEQRGEIDWDAVDSARSSPYSWLQPPDHLGFLFGTGHYRRGLRLLVEKLRQALANPAILRDFVRYRLLRRTKSQ